jgi:hypothetical protein
MQEEINIELEKAHKFAATRISEDGEPVLVFEFNRKMYLSKKTGSAVKTKLIFNGVVKAIGWKNSKNIEEPNCQFLFEANSSSLKWMSKKYFTSKEMVSKKRFSGKLLGMIPWLEFLGNTDDFSQYISSECSKMLDNQQVIEELEYLVPLSAATGVLDPQEACFLILFHSLPIVTDEKSMRRYLTLENAIKFNRWEAESASGNEKKYRELLVSELENIKSFEQAFSYSDQLTTLWAVVFRRQSESILKSKSKKIDQRIKALMKEAIS